MELYGLNSTQQNRKRGPAHYQGLVYIPFFREGRAWIWDSSCNFGGHSYSSDLMFKLFAKLEGKRKPAHLQQNNLKTCSYPR